MREGDFALLRFDDFDVRAELTEKNKISPYCVSIVGYYTREEYTSQINDEGLIEMDVSLAKGILPCVLTKMKKKDILAKLDEYYHNNEYYVDFDDHSYDTFEEYTVIFNEQGERLICSVFGVGKDFDYYPSKDLFWAYDSIYDSQRYMTVMKRPQ